VAFGKLFADDNGQTAFGFLRSARGALRPSTRSSRDRAPIAIPSPVAYDPACRLLLTDVLTGEPELPSLVKERVPAPGVQGAEAWSGLIRDLVTSCGRALALLHAGRAGTVPTRASVDVVSELLRGLDVVAKVWPQTAHSVQRYLQPVTRDLAGPVTAVLCHGDYTPSQVLSTRGRVTGLVDFDAVCWGDPAMDLGRFLAHLDLLVTKVSMNRGPTLTVELAGCLLRAYHDASAGRVLIGHEFMRRVAAYRALSLATSAVRSCRQLKDRRLSVAMSLLQTAEDWTGRVDP
jgi:aminoglycoside phosphotransferase (APT) family kinase protein